MRAPLPVFLSSDRGATAIEYGLIAGLMVVACLHMTDSVGENLRAVFDSVVRAFFG